MNALVAILSPLALLLPAVAGPLPAKPANNTAQEAAARTDLPKGFASLPAGPFAVFEEARKPQEFGQVRIEQRVIIRISPGRPKGREDMLARAPRSDPPSGYKEKKLHGCIAIDDIAGVEPVDDNRLLLFMRDHRVLSAALERACDADDFYLGFYVERNADGMLCSKRDRLQSRTGATCQVTQLNRLVATKD